MESYVKDEDVDKLIGKYNKKKNKSNINSRIIEINREYIPYYVIETKATIKRGFNLSSKVIEHIYLVNSISGKMNRLDDSEKFNEVNKLNFLKKDNSMKLEDCEKMARRRFYKHVVRFYKSFWAPDFETISKSTVYIEHISVISENKQNLKMKTVIHSYSGDINVSN